MQAAVITFPGSNCDRDLAIALERHGAQVDRVWHQETTLKAYGLIGVPGGFSYGDYLRCGAISARSPVMAAVADAARAGRFVLGICNGFQILTECGLLPGALIRNADLRFVCRPESLVVSNNQTAFSAAYSTNQTVDIPIAHHDGQFVIDDDGLERLKGGNRIVFRYCQNPNGSRADIAGIINEKGNVLGMMPHPERAADPLLGLTDGSPLFNAIIQKTG